MGAYQPGLPAKPKPDVLAQLNTSFSDLLKANDLVNLIPVFMLCPIFHSYHLLLEIPAFYGLWWYNPVRVTALVDFESGTLKVPRYAVLQTGWQDLWKTMVEQHEIHVVTNTQVTNISRDKDGVAGRLTCVSSTDLDATSTIDFDLLVVACNIKSAVQVMEDATAEELEIGGALNDFTLCSTVFESEVVEKERPIELFPFPKRNNAFGQVFGQVNPRLLFGKEAPKSGVDRKIVYQFLNHAPRREDAHMLKRRLKMYFDDQGIKKPSIITQCPWKFFSHFSSEDISQKEVPWKIYDMQGQNKTIYVGASVCVDSVNEIINYNQALVESLQL